MTQTTTPAGWYHDPTAPQQLRYWDGAAWTAHVSPVPSASAAPGGAGTVATAARRGLHPAVTTLIVVAAVMVIVSILAAVSIPVYLNQRHLAEDAAAQGAAMDLGTGILQVMIDDPTIGLADATEAIDGTVTITDGFGSTWTYTMPEGVMFGGAEGSGYEGFCVWVTSESGSPYEYDWIDGLSEGSC